MHSLQKTWLQVSEAALFSKLRQIGHLSSRPIFSSCDAAGLNMVLMGEVESVGALVKEVG